MAGAPYPNRPDRCRRTGPAPDPLPPVATRHGGPGWVSPVDASPSGPMRRAAPYLERHLVQHEQREHQRSDDERGDQPDQRTVVHLATAQTPGS